jgi:spore coat polysaccharide biosynthesis protein SpsF (cytidylyltransferase family)
MTAKALYRAEREASTAEEREHVTPWLRRHPQLRRVKVEGPGGKAAEQRWTLDYPEDYDFLVRLFAHLPPLPAIPPWRDVLDLLDAHPDVPETNAVRRVHP